MHLSRSWSVLFRLVENILPFFRPVTRRNSTETAVTKTKFVLMALGACASISSPFFCIVFFYVFRISFFTCWKMELTLICSIITTTHHFSWPPKVYKKRSVRWKVTWSIRQQLDWIVPLLTDCLTDWQTDWLTAWLTDRQTDWLSDWLTDRQTDWLTVQPAVWLNYWPNDWLTEWLTVWQDDCLNGSWSTCLITGWLVSLLINWLTVWVIDGLF